MNIDKIIVSEESGQYLTCLCPYHNDSIASLVINKVEHNGRKKGYYYCFGCGKSGEITSEEVDKLASKKGYTKRLRPVNWYRKAVEFTSGCLLRSYPGDLIYEESSEDYMIGWTKMGYNGFYICPMYNANQEVIGIHTRALDGTKRSMEGSKLGLFLPKWFIKPGQLENKTIIICEGLSDTLVAAYCTGLYSIGLPSAAFGHTIVRDFLKNIDFNGKIIIVCDMDNPGFKSTNKLTDILDRKYPIKVILPTSYSDLYEFFQHNEQKKTRKLLLGDENERQAMESNRT